LLGSSHSTLNNTMMLEISVTYRKRVALFS